MTEKYQFQCDYIAGCHPEVLKALCETNMDEVPGYAEDKFCLEAADLIRKACGLTDAAVHFFAGGTQTNLTVVSAALRPHQGVVACDSGHVEAHETGAIEATGHKVITVAGVDGKVTVESIEKLCKDYFENEEKVLLVQPGMLYISFPTETGTIYSLAELEGLAAVCKHYGLLFYIDGARLAYGLAASPDVKITDIARLADAFYLGGTKCGTLGGEALVIKHEGLKKDFAAIMRRHGALLAKGRFVGVQFLALMKDGLYFEIGRTSVDMAMRLRQALIEAGCEPDGNSPTNQQFFAITEKQAQFLSQKYRYELCGRKADGRLVVRFCTAWSTKPEVLDELIADIQTMKNL